MSAVSETRPASAGRFHPWTWISLLCIAAVLTSFHVIWQAPAMRQQPLAWLSALGVPLLFAFGFVKVAAIPWRYFGSRHFALGAMAAVAVSLIWIAATVILDVRVLLPRIGIQQSAIPVLRFNLILWVPTMVMAGAIIAQRQKETEARLRAEALTRNTRARLLQSQLHPHVLFNTINGLAELARHDGEATEDALVTLGELLRDLMRVGERDRIALMDERRLVERQLHLESLRLGRRLQVEWSWPDELDAHQVPPLLLQPLVENAIKHGISAKREGGRLWIEGSRQGQSLHLSVMNTGKNLVDGARAGGLGLRNLRERLALIYGDEGRFTLSTEQERTCARLEIPLNDGEASS
jgi:two-component system, LytTR family, sensor kinase